MPTFFQWEYHFFSSQVYQSRYLNIFIYRIQSEIQAIKLLIHIRLYQFSFLNVVSLNPLFACGFYDVLANALCISHHVAEKVSCIKGSLMLKYIIEYWFIIPRGGVPQTQYQAWYTYLAKSYFFLRLASIFIFHCIHKYLHETFVWLNTTVS